MKEAADWNLNAGLIGGPEPADAAPCETGRVAALTGPLQRWGILKRRSADYGNSDS
jgi:hypothetical protein